MYRRRPRADHRLRKASRDLLSEPAIRLLLPGPDQPAPVGKHFAARSDCGAKQGLAAGRGQERLQLSIGMPAPGACEPYSAAVRSSAFSARTAQNLNSGILPNGSSAGLVKRFAAASA